MFFSISKKLLVVFVAVVALMLMVGLGTALAAQHHDDTPARFAVTTMPLVAYATPTTTSTTRHLIGTIQSIDQAKKTFTLLVTGQTKAITIAFNAKTKLHERQQTFKLTAKAHVLVDVSTRGNGTFYAVEVEPVPAGYAHGAGHMAPHGTCAPGTRPGMQHS